MVKVKKRCEQVSPWSGKGQTEEREDGTEVLPQPKVNTNSKMCVLTQK